MVLSLKKGREKAIGFVYDNDDSRQPMSERYMTVDEVEKLTGLDFFADLDKQLEKRIEKACNISDWK